MKDFTLKDFEELVKYFEKSNEEEAKRRKQWNKDNQLVKITATERLIHQRSDALLGLYPMNKEKLLERIELLSDAWMQVDFNGMMYPTKPTLRFMVQEYLDNSDLEKIYDYYLTEVKPYESKNV